MRAPGTVRHLWIGWPGRTIPPNELSACGEQRWADATGGRPCRGCVVAMKRIHDSLAVAARKAADDVE